jgi:hypothetical protein
MVYNDFGDFLNNPPSFGSNSVFQKNVFLAFLDFPGASGLQKGKVKEHGSEFSRRTLWDKYGDQEPNRLQTESSHTVRFPGRVGHARSPLVAPMSSIFVPVTLS